MTPPTTIYLPHDGQGDYLRMQFFQALGRDLCGKNPVILSDYERGFFASWCKSSRPSLWFTPNRRPIVDQMWAKYGGEINHPHPHDIVQPASRPAIADADATGCQFIVKDDTTREQKRCNEPAEVQEPGKLRYCRTHGEWVRRANKGIGLVNFP